MSTGEYTISLDIELLSTCVTSTNLGQTFDADLLRPVSCPTLPENDVMGALRVADVWSSTLEQLCAELDMPEIGSSLLNWKWLAQELGMTSRQINQLEARPPPGVSVTRQVLRSCASLSVHQLLTTLAHMNRRDVALCLAHALSVLLTSACQLHDADSEPVKHVRWLHSNLRKHGAHVLRDGKLMGEADRLGVSWLAHADQCFDTADHVIVVLCDQYNRVMSQPQDADQQDTLAVGRHLFNRMQAEYLNRGCVNYRFRAIVFPLHGTTPVPVPSFLSNTVLFNWPGQQVQLFKLLFSGPHHTLQHQHQQHDSQSSTVDSGLVNTSTHNGTEHG